MRKRVLFITIIITSALLTGCAGVSRLAKSAQSSFTGGIQRKVTLYDYNGNEIESWTGKFDVSDSENEIYFDDESGKTVIIHGGITVNEEQ